MKTELLLKTIVKIESTLTDNLPKAANVDQDLVIEELFLILENKKLKKLLKKEHKSKVQKKTWKSSNVAITEYDPLFNSLRVTFNDGRIYNYAELTKKVWKQLQKAESIGKFLHKCIIPKYKATQIN